MGLQPRCLRKEETATQTTQTGAETEKKQSQTQKEKELKDIILGFFSFGVVCAVIGLYCYLKGHPVFYCKPALYDPLHWMILSLLFTMTSVLLYMKQYLMPKPPKCSTTTEKNI